MDNTSNVQKALLFLFWCHDEASSFLTRHLFVIKRLILVVAHLSLFGLFFPEMRKDFGSMAEVLLFGILFLSPLSKIFRMRLLLQMMSLRRELGIFMAYLVTVHVTGFFIDPQWLVLLTEPYLKGGVWALDPGLLFGIAAYLLTLPLLLTSNAFAQRSLGKYWKPLHRIVYVVFVFTVMHHMLIRGRVDPGSLFQAAVLILAYISVKILAWKSFLPPLQRSIDFVATRYREYGLSQKAPAMPS